jgi:hypothetical protein
MIRTILLTVLAATLASPAVALAEPPAVPAASAAHSINVAQAERSIAAAAARHAAAQHLDVRRPGYQIGSPGRRGRVARKVIGGIAGGVGGFFLGGFLGAKLEPNCGCDDPGLKGFLLGAPIGAVAGAVVGTMVD